MAELESLKRYRKLHKRRKELKEKVKDIEGEMKEVEKEVKDYMIDNGITSLNIEGNNIYIHTQLWASVPKSTKKEGWDKLKEHPQFRKLVENSVNTHSLSSIMRDVKQSLDLDESLEDWLEGMGLDDVIQTYERKSVRVKKSN